MKFHYFETNLCQGNNDHATTDFMKPRRIKPLNSLLFGPLETCRWVYSIVFLWYVKDLTYLRWSFTLQFLAVYIFFPYFIFLLSNQFNNLTDIESTETWASNTGQIDRLKTVFEKKIIYFVGKFVGKGAFTLNVRDKVRGNFVRHNRIDKLIIRDLRYRSYLDTLQSNESLSLKFL